jgi:predicted transglutaminase-like cysteine proteinase
MDWAWWVTSGRPPHKLLLPFATFVGLALPFLLGPGSQGAVAQAERPLPVATNTLAALGEARPTRAWREFCERLPTECRVDLTEPEIIDLTPAAWAEIVSVNKAVNRRVQGVTDYEHWGVEDRWDYPDNGKGDCEDIQLLKRKVLAEKGLSRRAMRMTVVVDREGAGHAVLMVRTNRGDLILDNKRDAVLPWKRTGYVYLKREGAQGSSWVSVGHQAEPIITANR